jgi:predicted nucleic acid-binding protein
MSVLVIDASVAAKWFIDEEHAEEARTLLDGRNQLHAPDFFALEMDSMLCKWIRHNIIAATEGENVRSVISRLPIQQHSFLALRDSAYAMANLAGVSLYDCLYVALAAVLKGRMVTADRRLYNGAVNGTFGRHIVWIGDLAQQKM